MCDLNALGTSTYGGALTIIMLLLDASTSEPTGWYQLTAHSQFSYIRQIAEDTAVGQGAQVVR